MDTQVFPKKRRALWLHGLPAMLALLVTVQAVAVTITTNPQVIRFEDPAQTIHLELKADDTPIRAEDIGTVQLLVDGVVYDDVIEIRKEAGRLVLTPTDRLQVGTYDLLIETASGPATVRVYSPLSPAVTTLEAPAKQLGISVTELEQNLGLQIEGRKQVELDFSPVYYVGQTIRIDMNTPADRDYHWTVNGREVGSGRGGHKFSYTFTDPGTCVFIYAEKLGAILAASAIETVEVVGRPTVRRTYAPGKEFKLTAPPGYTNYTWKVNGQPVGTGETFVYTFPDNGTYKVEVAASDPKTTPYDEYRAIVYNVLVSTQ